MKDLVSILVPVYNVEMYIGRCAFSLFAQTYENLEYIFVDDCSPDNSIGVVNQVIADFPSRKMQVHIIKHNNNLGLAAARNTALEHAHGKYVMHVDSDDYIDITTVEKAVNKLHEDNADVVIFGMNHIFKEKNVPEIVNVPTSPKKYVVKLIARECPVCLCGGMYLRNLYVDNNLQAVPGLNMGEDYATKPRVVYYAKKIAFIGEPLYNYVHYNEGAYTRRFSERHIKDLRLAISTLENFFHNVIKDDSFDNALQKAKGEVWSELLISWGINRGSNKCRVILHNVFPSINIGLLRPSRRLLVWLAQKNLFFILRLYCIAGYWLKNVIK